MVGLITWESPGWIGCLLGTALLACAFVTPTATAQAGQQDPTLPDIAPRVVEIRGQLEISMPSLQRQPLIGFNPPPRVAPIPPERAPFTEEYKQESIDLPPSPLQAPEPPPVASLIGQAPRTGRLSASAGRYLSRSVSFESEWPMSNRAAIYSSADYRGSDGHHPDGTADDVSASYDALDALVGVQLGSSAATFGFEVDGFLNQYLMFGAVPSPGAGHLINDPPVRDGRGGGVTGWVRSQAAVPVDVGVELRYGIATYETDALVDGSTSSATFFREEQAFESTVDFDAPLGDDQRIRADVGYTFLDLDDSPPGYTSHMFDGAGGLRLSLGRNIEFIGLGRVMTFVEEADRSHTYASPDVRLNIYPATGFRLYVENRPRMIRHTTTTSMRENPYLVDDFIIQPTVYTLDARGGGRIMAGAFEADLHGGYSRAPNFRFFERATVVESDGYSQGFITADYAEAAIYYVGGDVAVILPAGFSLSAGLTFRDGTLTESDASIPYFGPLLARGALSYAFADGRGFVQAVTEYESAREVSRENAREIGDYFDLDIEATYDVTPNLGVLLNLENLSAGFLERWEHYDQSPFVIGGGLQIRW